MPRKPERFLQIYDKTEDTSKPSPWTHFYIDEAINYWNHGQPLAFFSFQKSGKNTLIGNLQKALECGLIIIDCGQINKTNADNLINVEEYIEDQRTRDGAEPIVFIDEADFGPANRAKIHQQTIYPYISTAISSLVLITNKGNRVVAATNYPASVDSTLFGLFRPVILYFPLPNADDRLLIIKQTLETSVSIAPPINLNNSDLASLVRVTKYSPTGWLIGTLNIIRSKEISDISNILTEVSRLPIQYSRDERNDFKEINRAFLLGDTRAKFPFGRH